MSVIKFLIFLYPVILVAQDKLEGKYNILDGTGHFTTIYNFTSNGIFEYEHSGDLGLEKYGKGHYFIKKDSLILNYDLTEPKLYGYHKSTQFINSSDSVTVKIKVFDLEKNIISNHSVGNIELKNKTRTNSEGVAILKFKKENKQYNIRVANYYRKAYEVDINTLNNYYVEVYLRAEPYIQFAMKDEVEKFKIRTRNDSVLKLDKGTLLVTLIKVKRNN